ncbi:hypothetical protein L6R46_32295, partial [Myxococcota bacterium]|nr:hypothetical protein [Myxococcota bacterium]
KERDAAELGRDVGVGDLNYVVALDAGRGPRLAAEPVEGHGIGDDGRVEDLEGEALVGVHVLHEKDRAHAALAQALFNSVTTREDRPRLDVG